MGLIRCTGTVIEYNFRSKLYKAYNFDWKFYSDIAEADINKGKYEVK